MLNSIDQGEIMSPLLWIIYYDPVFTKIKKEKDNYVKYGKNTTIIKPLKKGDSTWFLGVWISDKNNKNFVKKQIQKDVQTIYNLTRGKLVTAEQMAYVLNAVAIPRIEYKAH